MKDLITLALDLPQEWKWHALFVAPEGHEREWQAWLAQAQRAEDETVLRSWAHRSGAGDTSVR